MKKSLQIVARPRPEEIEVEEYSPEEFAEIMRIKTQLKEKGFNAHRINDRALDTTLHGKPLVIKRDISEQKKIYHALKGSSTSKVCQKFGISPTYAWKLKQKGEALGW